MTAFQLFRARKDCGVKPGPASAAAFPWAEVALAALFVRLVFKLAHSLRDATLAAQYYSIYLTGFELAALLAAFVVLWLRYAKGLPFELKWPTGGDIRLAIPLAVVSGLGIYLIRWSESKLSVPMQNSMPVPHSVGSLILWFAAVALVGPFARK